MSACLIGQSFAQISSKLDLELLFGKNESLKRKIFKDGNTDYIVTSAYTDNQLNLNHVYIQQSFKGINAYNVIQSLVFRNNELRYSSGNFIAHLSNKAGSEIPTLTAIDAINKATNHLGLAPVSTLDEVFNTFSQDKKIIFNTGNIAQENIRTELVWVTVDAGKSVHLAWDISIAPLKSSDVWHIRVDAQNGNILEKGNYTVYEKRETKNVNIGFANTTKSIHQRISASLKSNQILSRLMAPPTTTSATYYVVPFPNENPYVNGLAIETDPWNKAGINNDATTYGWHFNGATNYNLSRGNNVSAYDDSLNKNAPGRYDTSSTAIPSLKFNTLPDFTQEPTTRSNRKSAITNLFYWNNIMHDATYQYGFTEPAGNFQNNNISRGGKAADYVRAEAQDGLGLDNANFSAQPDGLTARMQMFLWTALKKTGLILNIPSSSAAGDYTFVESAFSTANKLSATGAISGEVALYNDDAAGTAHRACTVASTNPLTGKIALIYRGGCNFTVKVKNAENGGAIAVIMVDTLVGATPIIMGGTDNTITIPAVMITNGDGAGILAALKANETVPATINVPVIGPKFDGDLDAGVMCHEYTHGISNRLTGGPSTTSCLSNAEQGGEGWSDYVSLMLTTDWTKAKLTDDTIRRFIGNYVANQRPDATGIRRKPYTTDMGANPHIYSDLSTSSEVHDIGEVWCSALWDMTWALIQQESSINPNIFNPSAGGGNAKALQLVMTGLKLQPCSPGFLDARNAILAADTLLYGGAHVCTIWQAFANRGMGYSADQGSNTVCGDELDGFDVPPCTLPLKLLSFNGSPVENKVALRWNTTAEVNSKQFIVEYSVNNTSWTSIGTVAAKNTIGNNEYALTHTQPENGVNYYRLKMIDINGSFSYSSVVSVKFAGKEGISIYPNPVKETINAELFKGKSEKATVSISDITGRILVEKQVELQKGFNLIQLNTSELTKGTYLLIVNGSNKTVKQFIKE